MNTCKNLYSSVPWSSLSSSDATATCQMPSDLTIPIDIEWNNINLEDLGADTQSIQKHSDQYNIGKLFIICLNPFFSKSLISLN